MPLLFWCHAQKMTIPVHLKFLIITKKVKKFITFNFDKNLFSTQNNGADLIFGFDFVRPLFQKSTQSTDQYGRTAIHLAAKKGPLGAGTPFDLPKKFSALRTCVF